MTAMSTRGAKKREMVIIKRGKKGKGRKKGREEAERRAGSGRGETLARPFTSLAYVMRP